MSAKVTLKTGLWEDDMFNATDIETTEVDATSLPQYTLRTIN